MPKGKLTMHALVLSPNPKNQLHFLVRDRTFAQIKTTSSESQPCYLFICYIFRSLTAQLYEEKPKNFRSDDRPLMDTCFSHVTEIYCAVSVHMCARREWLHAQLLNFKFWTVAVNISFSY